MLNIIPDNCQMSFYSRKGCWIDPGSPSKMTRAVYCLWGILGAYLILLILFSKSIRYAEKQQVLHPILLMGFAVVFETGLYGLMGKIPVSSKHSTLYTIVFAGFFFFIQLFLVTTYFFKTGWDVQGIISAAESLAIGDASDKAHTEYLSRYPNNILLVFLFSKVLSFGYAVGLGKGVTYFLLLVLQCIISALTGIFTYLSAFCLTGSRVMARCSYVIYLLLIGLSPWVSIPYSDSMGLLFPIFLLWLSMKKPAKSAMKCLKWAVVGFLAYTGYKIKPTVFIIFIALLIVEAGDSIRRKDGKTFAKKVVLVLSGVVLAGSLLFFVHKDFGYRIEPEHRFGAAHFFAMGLNEERMGVWAGDDVAFSASFHTNCERDRADLNLALQRIGDMGIVRVAVQYMRKTLTSFNDGTFAWLHEGNFFRVIYERTDPLSRFVRSFYYADGSNVKIFQNTEQAIWLSVLFFAVTVCFTQPNKEIAVWLFSLIGLVIYVMLFEARARYVFIFAPVFIVLAAYGFCAVLKFFRMTRHIPASC